MSGTRPAGGEVTRYTDTAKAASLLPSRGYSHGMRTTNADTINADLLACFKTIA